jgi:hypothetical protein
MVLVSIVFSHRPLQLLFWREGFESHLQKLVRTHALTDRHYKFYIIYINIYFTFVFILCIQKNGNKFLFCTNQLNLQNRYAIQISFTQQQFCLVLSHFPLHSDFYKLYNLLIPCDSERNSEHFFLLDHCLKI